MWPAIAITCATLAVVFAIFIWIINWSNRKGNL